MSSPSSTRLERALELFVTHQQTGGDWQALLLRHPDLADLLQSFEDDPSTPAAAEGERLGDFVLVREVGRGGVGAVHEARQRSLDRRVALKVLHAAFTANPTALARFRREAQTLARLDHPGIVHVFAVGEDGGQHWLAMEFVDGESLDARLDGLRASGGHHGESLRRMVESIAEIGFALHHAHAAGIVHRDVKPSNILLRPGGNAVLGDFGLARDAEDASLTQTGVAAGTPHYMAPEQIVGHATDCDARTDVFALGATLYECLTLRRAFDGENSQQVLQAILTRDPVDPRRVQRGLPAELAAITMKALEKDPAARYPTAQAFGDDLRAFLELRPVAARPPSRTRRLMRLARRQPTIGVVLLLVLVSGGLGSAFLWQLPAMRAAAAVRTGIDYEDALVAGLMARTGKDEAACLGHFHRALELRPDDSEAVAGLCLALRHFEGPAAALAELDRRLGNAPPDDVMGRCRALLLRRLERLDEAKALEERLGPPTTPMALWLGAVAVLADARDSQKGGSLLLDDALDQPAVQQADRMLSLAVRIAPHPRLLLHAQWALVHVLLDDSARRRESAEALLLLWPDHPVALFLAGTNLLQLDAPRALGLLQRALQLGLEDPLGRLNLAVAQARTGQSAAALLALEQAFAQSGLTDVQRVKIVRIAGQLGDVGLQGRLCEGWLQQDPQNPAAIGSMGRYASQHGDHERALRLLRQNLAGAPEDFERRWHLAFALASAVESEAAHELLLLLVKQSPGHEGTHLLMLDVCEDLEDAPAALVELQRWVEVRPDDGLAWRDLAAALLQSPAPDAAERGLAAAERANYLARGTDAANLELHAQAHDRLGHRDEATRLRARAAALPKTPTPR